MNKASNWRTKVVVYGVLAVLWSCAQVVDADFTYGPATKIPNVSRPGAGSLQISPDGLELYFAYNAENQCRDLWVARRSTTKEPWGAPVPVVPPVHPQAWMGAACISADGLELYFGEGHPYHWLPGYGPDPSGYGKGDLWVCRRAVKGDPWDKAQNVGPMVNTAGFEDHPSLSADGLSLYFASDRAGNVALYVTRRPTKGAPWAAAEKLGAPIDMPMPESTPFVSPDDLSLYFAYGPSTSDIYVSKRSTTTDPWGPPELFPAVNSTGAEYHLSFSAGDSTLYFVRGDSFFGGFDLWQVQVFPTIDFNGDGEVDEKDLLVMTEHWGQDYPACDIGPMAWGDGVVDENDLRVLMEQLMTPGPQASDVSCDTLLSWVGPGFADSYDVYFGTSLDDVSNATRDDPCDVLGSEGQMETTYDPEGLLEFGQTYYWRVDSVDVVIGSLEPMIFRGPILKFTTEPFARPIQNIAATASSRERGMGPENTVNGSGLDKNDGHSTDGKAMWLSRSTGPHWIQYEFDQVYTLHELWVWNSNQLIEPILGFGAKTVKIEYSVDGATWTTLEAVPEFARAPGEPAYKPNTTVSFGGVSAKYVMLSIEANWGVVSQTGLAEVRFFHIPDRSWATTP